MKTISPFLFSLLFFFFFWMPCLERNGMVAKEDVNEEIVRTGGEEKIILGVVFWLR